VTHVFVNRGWVPFERVVKGFRYLREGSVPTDRGSIPHFIADDFEDPWSRGRHDASKVATMLGQLLAESPPPPRPGA
jgi:hypothetical protein